MLEIPRTLSEYRRLWGFLEDLRSTNADEWATAMRWYCKEDLFFLCNFVLSCGAAVHSDTEAPFLFSEYHLDKARKTEWQLENGGGSDVSARRTGKTEFRSFGAPIKCLLKYPDAACCLNAFTLKLARKHAMRIRGELAQNPLLIELFSGPEAARVGEDILWGHNAARKAREAEASWDIEAFSIKGRTRNRVNQNFEVHPYVQNVPIGSGFDYIFADDVVERDHAENEDKRMKARTQWVAYMDLLTPTVVGQPAAILSNTRYHPEDLASNQHDRNAELDPRKAIAVPGEDLSRFGDGPLGGVPVYPYTTRTLFLAWDAAKEEPGGESNYALQRCLSFHHADRTKFGAAQMELREESAAELARGKRCYLLVDPSLGMDDPSALVGIACGRDRRVGIVYLDEGRITPTELPFAKMLAEAISWLNEHGSLVEVRVEEQGQSTYHFTMRQLLGQMGLHPRIVPCKSIVSPRGRQLATGKQQKVWDRLSAPAQAGKFYIPRPASQGGKGLVMWDRQRQVQRDFAEVFLRDEWGMFPRNKRDHWLDALALAFEPDITPINYGETEADYRNWTPQHRPRRGSWRAHY